MPAAAAARGAEREAQLRELGRQQGAAGVPGEVRGTTGARTRRGGPGAGRFCPRARRPTIKKIEAEAVQLALEHCAQGAAPRGAGGSAAVDGDRAGGSGTNRRRNWGRAGWCIRSKLRIGGAIWLRAWMRENCRRLWKIPAMALEQCELRTSMGTAELGLEVQLKEIEQGLMDLLAARPQENQGTRAR